jgi:hypothetical protein
MIDVPSFITERERLKRFCFRRTKAAIVLRDVARSKDSDTLPRLAKFLQFLLTVDARRFIDPDDVCSDFGPTIFAFPTYDAKRDAATIIRAGDGSEAVVVDYRIAEAVWPLLAPTRAPGTPRSVKIWDREMRKRGRICAVLTLDAAVDQVAIQCDGGRLLRRSGGETSILPPAFGQKRTPRSRDSDACAAKNGVKRIFGPREAHSAQGE